jgi:hypothetical protein
MMAAVSSINELSLHVEVVLQVVMSEDIFGIASAGKN